MEHRRSGGIRAHQVAEGRRRQQGTENSGRNAPVDHLLLQQEQAAQQIAEVDPAPADAAPTLEQRAAQDLAGGEPLSQAGFQGIEGGRHGETIHPLLELGHAVAVEAKAGEDH